MSVSVEKLPNQPIIIAMLEGQVTVPMMTAMFQQSANLMAGMEGPVYRITNVQASVNTTFGDILHVVKEASKGVPGSTTDPRVKPVFVGSHAMVKLAANMLEQGQFGSVHLPIFKSMDDALDYIYTELGYRQAVGE